MTEPDAWATFGDTYHVMDDLDADKQCLRLREDTHAEALYSESTIKQLIQDKIDSLRGYENQEIRPEHILKSLLEELKGEAL